MSSSIFFELLASELDADGEEDPGFDDDLLLN